MIQKTKLSDFMSAYIADRKRTKGTPEELGIKHKHNSFEDQNKGGHTRTLTDLCLTDKGRAMLSK